MENNTVTIRAKVSFPSLVDQITYRGAPTGKYGVQLANLSAPAVEKLEELGIEVKTKPDDKYERGQFLECKSQFPINNEGKYAMLFEADRKTKFEGSPSQIGYGSVVLATIRPFQGKDGVVRPSLVKLAVEELVEPEVTAADDGGEIL